MRKKNGGILKVDTLIILSTQVAALSKQVASNYYLIIKYYYLILRNDILTLIRSYELIY